MESDEEGYRIEGCDFHVMGYLRNNEVLDPDLAKLCDITPDGRIRDTRLRNIGSIRSDGTVESSDFRIIVYTDGTHPNLRERVLAYLVFFGAFLD